MRLVFAGATGTGSLASGALLSATSPNGTTWKVAPGSLSHETVGVANIAATTEKGTGDTPVAAFASGRLFHVGIDPSRPATSADKTVKMTAGSAPDGPTLVTDAKTGSVWLGWHQNFVSPGYWVEQLLPTKLPPVKAPGSFNKNQNNEPFAPVALTARVGGGVYMAYCAPTNTAACAHIDLWKLGTKTPMVVPGTSNGHASHAVGEDVALAAGLQGRLSVVWYDGASNVIHAVRTNTSVTKFGVERTIKPPPKINLPPQEIQAEGTFGRLDVVVLASQAIQGGPFAFFHTQILAGLSLTASPKTFTHTAAHTVTFTVKDAGQPVSGAKVSCLGKVGTSSSSGVVKLTFPKGTKTGKHVATASHANYNPGKTTITVT